MTLGQNDQKTKWGSELSSNSTETKWWVSEIMLFRGLQRTEQIKHAVNNFRRGLIRLSCTSRDCTKAICGLESQETSCYSGQEVASVQTRRDSDKSKAEDLQGPPESCWCKSVFEGWGIWSLMSKTNRSSKKHTCSRRGKQLGVAVHTCNPSTWKPRQEGHKLQPCLCN